MKLVSHTLMACTLNEVLRTKISESPPLAPSLGTRTRLRSRLLELVGARKNGARQLGRREMSAFFFLRLPASKFASIRTKLSLGVKEDQRMLTVNPSL